MLVIILHLPSNETATDACLIAQRAERNGNILIIYCDYNLSDTQVILIANERLKVEVLYTSDTELILPTLCCVWTIVFKQL